MKSSFVYTHNLYILENLNVNISKIGSKCKVQNGCFHLMLPIEAPDLGLKVIKKMSLKIDFKFFG